ncbi:uncharacterized protein LOC142355063 [Convolutriloba macropyga]|uniref:uncharacterized protein LOC142355063 n=1 Tax=Convolutriloba macropyga TaxID=536237 RepID=UPI003F51FF68
MDEEPINDLALLKTSEAIELGHWIALPMCFERTLKKHSLRTTFSCCGLGSTSDNRNNVSLPKTLKETPFFQTFFEGVGPDGLNTCRKDNICTIPKTEGGNICDMDDGSPLFILDCFTMKPECLYGVASYYRLLFNKLPNF